jgi:hypothetical protein
MTPEIRTTRTWDADDVRQTCIRFGLYTRGDSAHYKAILEEVDTMQPTPENLYTVAVDICDHSEEQTVTNIMMLLEKYAVTTLYHIIDRP